LSPRVLLALMVTFLGLGYLAFFEPLRTQEKEDEKNERESHLVWLKDKKLESFSIVHKGRDDFAFGCANKARQCAFDTTGEWTLTVPVKDKADGQAVGTLLGTVANLTHNGKLDFEKGYDPKEYGLGDDALSVGLMLPGEAKPLLIQFGRAAAVGPNLYASVSTDPTHLYYVPNYLPGMIEKDLFHWRNKRLFPNAEATAVSRIEWKSKKLGAVSAVRDGEIWRLEKPRAALASRIMLEGLGSTLAYASAKSVLATSRSAPAAKKVLAGAPELDVRFSLNGGGEHRIRLYPHGGGKERVALADDASNVYVVDAATFDRFEKDLPEYRARSILTDAERAPLDEVRLEFPRDKQAITLQLKDGLWAPSAGDKPAGLIAQSRVGGFLDQLRDAEYKSFLPVSGASPEARAWRSQTPDLKVELFAGGKKTAAASFLVFDRRVALTESENEVRTFGETFLKILPVRLADLTEAVNRPVVTKPSKEGTDGHSAESERHGR
jgi:hypothetical protein